MRLWFVSIRVVVTRRDLEVTVVTENLRKISCGRGGVHRIFGSDFDAVGSVDSETVVT